MPRVFHLIPLLICLPCAAATVYKSVDARGRITFSDTPPEQAVTIEKLVIEVQPAASPELYLERMAAMTEITDKIAVERREREQARLEIRQQAETRYIETSPVLVQGSYSGYGSYSGQRRGYHRRNPHTPTHPIVHPPLQPLRGPALVNQYPASLVRRSYSPRVAAVFQNRQVRDFWPR